MQHENITKEIIGCAFEVINELGVGFLESVYEKSMLIALQELGLPTQSQQQIKVFFRDKVVGEFYADLLVDEKVLVELKTVKKILPQHEAQVINYLNATGISVGLLINFGSPKLEFKRLRKENHIG